MISISKSKANVLAAACTISVPIIVIWYFRLSVLSQGVADVSGGTHHLWWAAGAGIAACVASFYVFSVLARYDQGHATTII